jgi:galactitol-specific phosphotransferase system IIB component
MMFGNTDYQSRVNRAGLDFRMLRIIAELVDMGDIVIRTSPFKVQVRRDLLRAVYYNHINEKFTTLDKNLNIHDNGYNCWGGWGGQVQSTFNEGKIEEAMLVMTQRMKQLNIDDVSGNLDKISIVISRTYRDKEININPVTLAKLIIEYDVQEWLFKALTEAKNDYRRLDTVFVGCTPDNRLTLSRVRTTVDFNAFIELVKQMNSEFTGPKPKAGLLGEVRK